MGRFGVTGLSGSVAVCALMMVATSAPAYAQQAKVQFHLPAQALGDALRAFGQISNRQIIFSEGAVRGKKSAALIGYYTPEEGLRRLLAGSGLTSTRTASGLVTVSAPGEVVADAVDAPVVADQNLDILVTGTRIRGANIISSAPVVSYDAAEITDRGFTNMFELLNQATSNTPAFQNGQGQGFPAGNGKTSPNLFNLGSGRTLTLVNGRRMVATSSGLDDRTVDSGIIPTGLVDRVDIIQAGGATIYGSDAIAGVVNYVLKRNFSGLQLDVQDGISSRGDYRKPSVRLTAGRNFAGGRGNIAFDLEYSKTDPLVESDRPVTSSAPATTTNPLNLTTSDGLPPTVYVFGAHSWQYNRDGVIFGSNSSADTALLRAGGTALQFSPDGQSVVSYDPGAIQRTATGASTSVAVGGQGFDRRQSSTLSAGTERFGGTAIGHFDITDHLKVSGEFTYNRSISHDPFGTSQVFRFISSSTPYNAVAFNKTNPFLSASDVATLSAANPGFASGGNLYLSRFFDILPTRDRPSTTDTWRALLSVDGDFNLLGRQLVYSVSASRGYNSYVTSVYAPNLAHLSNALSATRVGGNIVCSINADAITTNDDPACSPLNPFGSQTADPRAVNYISALTGNRNQNTQDDYIASLSGDMVKLPGGQVKFSAAFEHREEKAAISYFDADLAGVTTTGSVPYNRDASYNTDELSGELIVPILGETFTLPLIKSLTANGSIRFVDHSIAGREIVWGAGLRWDTGYGLSFRASKSSNFRAPTLNQLYQPATTSPGNPLGTDPCDADHINGGSAPANRLANCQALFAANPGYGPLATFQDPAENTGLLAITSGGNPNLKNETSNTTTFGFTFEPRYIPGLSITADRINVDLSNGLTSLSVASIAALCFDNAPQPAQYCSLFTRNAQGYILAGNSTTVNASKNIYRGEVYTFSYRMPLSRWFNRDIGTLTLGVEGTHTSYFATSATGFDYTQSDGTTATPDWRVRVDARYAIGPLHLFYSIYYLPSVRSSLTDTIETTPVPFIASNVTHTVSMSIDATKNFTFRFGVNNLTDEQPSFPTRTYGDFLGRQFFVGAHAKF